MGAARRRALGAPSPEDLRECVRRLTTLQFSWESEPTALTARCVAAGDAFQGIVDRHKETGHAAGGIELPEETDHLPGLLERRPLPASEQDPRRRALLLRPCL